MTATVTAIRAEEEPTDWYALPSGDVCRRLGVDPAVGLSSAEVAERRERYGPNKLAEEAKEPAWQAFL
jgi:P-type Ca2+ transporter type 2C